MNDMILTYDIANTIVRETMSRLNRNINVIDTEGIIIASGDASRIGAYHVGALQAMRRSETIMIDEDNKQQWDGVQCGVNMPVYFQKKVVGAIGITGDPKEIGEIAELVRMGTELILNQSFLSSQQEWQSRTKESVLVQLMKLDSDDQFVDRQLSMLKMKLDPPYYALTMQLEDELHFLPFLLNKTEELFGSQHVLVSMLNTNQVYMLVFGLGESDVMKRRDEWIRLLRWSNIAFRMGISHPSHIRSEIPFIIKEAEFALQYADNEQPINYYAGLEPQMIIALSNETAKSRFLATLFMDMSDVVVQTLRVFLSCNLNIRQTAEALFVHNNTVIYRLKKVKESTHYDPQHFQDALALQVALWIYDS